MSVIFSAPARIVLLVSVLLVAACDRTTVGTLPCDLPTRVDTLPAALREASGIAASRVHPGILWAHNDAGSEPYLFALDTLGNLRGRVRIQSSLDHMDWEDIAVADCGDRTCIYLADIGDNYARRNAVRVLRFTEPDFLTDTVIVDPVAFEFRYPDSPHDAEAFFVLPGERVFVVTKGRNAPVALFAYPGPLRDDIVTLKHVQDFSTGLVQMPRMATGAASHPDGSTVAIRTYSFLRLYTAGVGDSLVSAGDSLSLASAQEFQGEGIAIMPTGTVFLVGEIGLDAVPPPLSRMGCR